MSAGRGKMQRIKKIKEFFIEFSLALRKKKIYQLGLRFIAVNVFP
jgi:hypothetical protein